MPCGTGIGGDDVRTARLQVVLRGVEPPVVRVIDVPSAATLPELHDLLQAAIGWTDSHLHQFVTADATYGMVLPGDDVWPEDQRDETGARLADLAAGFEYHYDFGDGWIHDVEMLGRGGEAPGCVDGHGACPPEDCGGPSGYAELLDTLADPADPDHQRMREWVSNRLRPFDRAAVDERVRQVVGEVPESVRLLLDLVAEGVKLTPGGRLPRRVVRAMQAHRPQWYPLGRPASIEEDLWPLVELHGLLRRVGLLRLRHGVLAPTRAAGDDLAVVRRLRSAFEPGTFATEITELRRGIGRRRSAVLRTAGSPGVSAARIRLAARRTTDHRNRCAQRARWGVGGHGSPRPDRPRRPGCVEAGSVGAVAASRRQHARRRVG
jgi:hypothetical protein